jgi:hypothetical protein
MAASAHEFRALFADNSNNRVPVELRAQLLRIANNSDDEKTLDLSQSFINPAVVSSVSKALRNNQQIEVFRFVIPLAADPPLDVSGICDFLRTSSSLKVFELSTEGSSEPQIQVADLLLNYLAENRSIERVVLGTDARCAVDGICALATRNTSITKLCLIGDKYPHYTDDQIEKLHAALAWAAESSLDVLQLGGKMNLLQNFLNKLSKSKTTKLKTLELGPIDDTLKTFLSSSSCNLQELHLSQLNFIPANERATISNIANVGYVKDWPVSSMSPLLWGLLHCKSCTVLRFKYCIFDELSLHKLVDAVKSDLCLDSLAFNLCNGAFKGEFLHDLLSHKKLKSLCLNGLNKHIDKNIEMVEEGLQNCTSLESLEISSWGYPERVMNALITPTTKYCLSRVYFSQMGIQKEHSFVMSQLLQHPNSLLQEIGFDDVVFRMVLFSILGAISSNNKIQSIYLRPSYNQDSAIWDMILTNFDKLSKIKTFSLALSGSPGTREEEKLLKVLSTNQNLEQVNIFQKIRFESVLCPPQRTIVSAECQGKIEFYCRRNQLKDTLLHERSSDEWFQLLEDMMKHREGLSLAFLLLREKSGELISHR